MLSVYAAGVAGGASSLPPHAVRTKQDARIAAAVARPNRKSLIVVSIAGFAEVATLRTMK
jgi:hypothetical protein